MWGLIWWGWFPRLMWRGKPRYLEFGSKSLSPVWLQISTLAGYWMLVLKEMANLVVLTKRTDHLWNWLRQSWIASISNESALEKIIKSLANIRWDIEGQFLATLMPLRSPSNSFCKISLDKTSVAIVKRKGDSDPLQKKSSCPSVFFSAFLQTAVIDKPIPALFVGALQSAAIGGL